MQFKSDSVAVFSGGLDSTTLVYQMIKEGYEPHLLSFNYGQRHKKELDYAANTAFKLGLRHDIVDLSGLTHLISNSALTAHDTCRHGTEEACDKAGGCDTIDVPEGHYAEDNMKLTVVPNRNMIMLSIAAGVMVNNNYKCIATGVHAGDHFVYPDCRPDFLRSFNDTVVQGNEGFGSIESITQKFPTQLQSIMYAPFLYCTKAAIAAKAFELEVPLADTWSCYKGGEKHCGKCGTCVERLEAIHEAVQARYGEKAADNAFFDNTEYEDDQYWKGVISNAKA